MDVSRDRPSAALALALPIALVAARSWVPVRYYAHFDSDQAVFGLMTRDLVAHRGFPMFFYGQRYLLGVSVWLCAPLFAVFGASIVTLKLPLFFLNVAVVCLLWIGLRREPGMGIWGTTLAILPFAMPSALVSTRLVEHAGGNIEPFVFVLAMFLLRERPIVLGLVSGVAFLNREFSLIALMALILMDAVQGTLWRKRRFYAIAIACAAGTAFALRVVAHWSNSYFGSLALYRRGGLENIVPLFSQHLPTLVGGAPRQLSDYNVLSSLTVGHWFVYYALIAWLLVVAFVLARVQPIERRELGGLSAFLILVGVGQAVAFVLLSPYPRDVMVVRYVLLTLLALCGGVAFAWRRPALRGITAAAILLMTAMNLAGNVQLIHEYATQPMERPLNQLADELVNRNVRYLRSDYWTAYDIAWLTGERVIAAPPGPNLRLPRYNQLLDAHQSDTFTLEDTPRRGCETILRWQLCPPASGELSSRR